MPASREVRSGRSVGDVAERSRPQPLVELLLVLDVGDCELPSDRAHARRRDGCQPLQRATEQPRAGTSSRAAIPTVPNHSIERGNWDEDAEALSASAAGKLGEAVNQAKAAGSATASATMGNELAEEFAAILECDIAAEATLSGALTALYAAQSEADGFE